MLLFLPAPAHGGSAAPLAELTWRIDGQPLQLQAGRGFAGAISAIRFRGRAFIDAADHGRELQGAVQFGAGECLNPTLAGASRDPPGASTSQLLSLQAGGDSYRSATRMAFWRRPGETCNLAQAGGQVGLGVASNRNRVSDLVYEQQMTPGFEGHANAVLVRIAIRNPHTRPPASVEALTGYMPPAFDRFSVYDGLGGGFRADPDLARTSGERDDPLVLSTADGSAAMGVVGLSGPVAPRYAGFHSDTVSKWSVVYHETAPFGPGVHRYACVWIIGTRREVQAALADIMSRSQRQDRLVEALAVGGSVAALILGGALLALRERRRRRRSPVPL